MEFRPDRLSNLPSNAMILSLLPVREAVRTSVLATKWRKRWAKLRQLAFDGQCVSSQSNTSFVTIVDHALLVHLGPLHSFKLSYNGNLASRDVDRWIVHLSRYSIKEFDLEYHAYEWDQYKIPACLFSWKDIIHLRLTNCLLQPLPKFKCFDRLKKLCIVRVTLAQDVLDQLVCCYSLIELVMIDCEGFTDLKIDVLKLKYLLFRGHFDYVFLEEVTAKLDVLSIRLESFCQKSNADRRLEPGRVQCRFPSQYIISILFFDRLSRVRELAIRGNFLQYLAVRVTPSLRATGLPCLCNLKHLTIDIHINNPEEISTALCIMDSSPDLQDLIIVACTNDQVVVGEVNSWLDDYNCIWSFTDLQIVQISNISGAKAELDFIRLLLLSTPVLLKMIIQPASVSDSSELLKKLLRLSRASVQSEIIYLDP